MADCKNLATLIVDKLKTGSIPNVVLFSDADVFPEPPCVVVRPEAGAREGTRSYRIMACHTQGNFDALERYVLHELGGLLLPHIDDANDLGETARYYLRAGGFTGITAIADRNAYFMERTFFSPLGI